MPFSSSWRFESYLLVPRCDTFLILHRIAETFGLNTESAKSGQCGVHAGSLTVTGTGKEDYFVLDSTGKAMLAPNRSINSVTDLLPGTYTVTLNGSQQRAGVAAGQQEVVHAGSLTVTGTGKEDYFVLDSTGKAMLAPNRSINSVTDLLPGTCVVELRERSIKISVQAGQRVVVNESTPSAH
jgi:hypothetical protein